MLTSHCSCCHNAFILTLKYQIRGCLSRLTNFGGSIFTMTCPCTMKFNGQRHLALSRACFLVLLRCFMTLFRTGYSSYSSYIYSKNLVELCIFITFLTVIVSRGALWLPCYIIDHLLQLLIADIMLPPLWCKMGNQALRKPHLCAV